MRLTNLVPKYWYLAVSGEKLHEYRKGFPDIANVAHICASSPVCALATLIHFDVPIIGSPTVIADPTSSPPRAA